MIRNDLKRHANTFLQTLSNKSDRTYAGYAEGLDAVMMFFDQYYEGDGRGKTIQDIEPQDVDHILSYFVIRKFLDGEKFRTNCARAVKAFFKYMAEANMYDKTKSVKIAHIADHYRKQYPRIEKLEKHLWDEVEGEIDEIMKLPKKQQEAAIDRLKAAAKDAELKEVGYVSVRRIEGNLIYGSIVDAKDEYVGPVRVGAESLKLVEVGDIINMITLRRLKGDSAWEIVELGYVYPRPYNGEA